MHACMHASLHTQSDITRFTYNVTPYHHGIIGHWCSIHAHRGMRWHDIIDVCNA